MPSTRLSAVFLRAVLGALVLGPCAQAQMAVNTPAALPEQQFGGGGSPNLPISETIFKRVDEVNLVFTVRDKKGRFVSDLQRDQVQVLDDRRPPESIRYFQQLTDLPLRVGLLVDVSGSVFYYFSLEQKAVTAFLQKVLRPQSDTAFVAGFDASVRMEQPLTDNTDLLSRAVRKLSPSGETALYDAVRHACRQLTEQNESGPSRRLIILFTDGMDNRSRATLSDAIETALRSEVTIYAISVNSPESGFNRAGEYALRQLTGATGGRVLPGHGPRQADKAFDSIQQELRSQYALAYRPAGLEPDGRYHTVQVRTSRSRKLRVLVRQGYYAPRETAADPSLP